MKKLSYGMATLVFAALIQASIADANVVQSKVQSQTNAKLVESNNGIAGQQLFNSACEAYINAQLIEDNTEVSKMYAKAISEISKSIALAPNNSDYWLLGSQIYRAKGGISYATRYFNNAEVLMLEKLGANPDDVTANLDYAIACYAGDVRFGSNYSAYNSKAEEHAKKVIKLCEAELKKEESSNLLRFMAIANLILGEQNKCQELLVKAKQMDSEDKEFTLWKFLGFKKEAIEKKTANIFYADLFENTVVKKQWLWAVDPKNIDKEFLLYYMTDETRNNDL